MCECPPALKLSIFFVDNTFLTCSARVRSTDLRDPLDNLLLDAVSFLSHNLLFWDGLVFSWMLLPIVRFGWSLMRLKKNGIRK